MHKVKKLFGTDGVRGRANSAPMDSETALALGRAVGALFRNGHARHRIVIGKDTRLSGYMIETALASGVCSMGADVWLVGPMPTPGIAFIAKSMRADAGVVISASHNPYHDNGIKFFDRDGFKLSDEQEHRIERMVATNFAGVTRPTGDGVGRAHRIDDADGRYIQFLKEVFPHRFSLSGLRLVVDCANGAAYKVAPSVFEELGAEVIPVGTDPDGLNINEGCGALHPERMCALVKKVKANAGIALDGDADRIIMCDENGTVIDGDVIMGLAAIDLKRRGRLAHDTLVATVMSNLALDQAMAREGITVERTPVGDRHVVTRMREGGFTLGGEQSGHLVFLDYNSTGDGIVGALRVLAIMQREEKALSQLTNIFEPFPQICLNVAVSQKPQFTTIPEISRTVAGFERELGNSGRLVLRYSGTENIARVMVEGKDASRIQAMAQDLVGILNTHLS